MSLTIRDKYAWQQFTDEKANGMGNLIPGTPLFVLPGSASTHNAYVRGRHKYVYNDVNAAYADVVSGRGDCIVLLPGAHTLTAALAVTANNVKIYGPEAFYGMDAAKPSAVLTAFAANKGITVTGTDFTMVGVTCVPVTAKSFLDFTVAAINLRVKGCHFDMNTPVVNIATKGIVATGAATGVLITGCEFNADGAQGPAIDATALLHSRIEGNFIYNTAGSWAVGIQTGAGCLGLRIGNNRIHSYGTALTVGIDLTGADQVAGIEIEENLFNSLVTGPVKNASGNTIANITNNFKGTVGAGSGGALVTVII
jgi:hypothetical protein